MTTPLPPSLSIDKHWMQQALLLAKEAAYLGEVPVGAIVVYNERIVGRGYNQPITRCDPSAHAEIQALRAAAITMHNYRLTGCTLYVTIEPCTMCVGALIHSRIERLVYGACEPKAGAVESQSRLLEAPYFNHHINVSSGVCADECSRQVTQFFAEKRRVQKQIKKTLK